MALEAGSFGMEGLVRKKTNLVPLVFLGAAIGIVGWAVYHQAKSSSSSTAWSDPGTGAPSNAPFNGINGIQGLAFAGLGRSNLGCGCTPVRGYYN